MATSSNDNESRCLESIDKTFRLLSQINHDIPHSNPGLSAVTNALIVLGAGSGTGVTTSSSGNYERIFKAHIGAFLSYSGDGKSQDLVRHFDDALGFLNRCTMHVGLAKNGWSTILVSRICAEWHQFQSHLLHAAKLVLPETILKSFQESLKNSSQTNKNNAENSVVKTARGSVASGCSDSSTLSNSSIEDRNYRVYDPRNLGGKKIPGGRLGGGLTGGLKGRQIGVLRGGAGSPTWDENADGTFSLSTDSTSSHPSSNVGKDTYQIGRSKTAIVVALKKRPTLNRSYSKSETNLTLTESPKDFTDEEPEEDTDHGFGTSTQRLIARSRKLSTPEPDVRKHVEEPQKSLRKADTIPNESIPPPKSKIVLEILRQLRKHTKDSPGSSTKVQGAGELPPSATKQPEEIPVEVINEGLETIIKVKTNHVPMLFKTLNTSAPRKDSAPIFRVKTKSNQMDSSSNNESSIRVSNKLRKAQSSMDLSRLLDKCPPVSRRPENVIRPSTPRNTEVYPHDYNEAEEEVPRPPAPQSSRNQVSLWEQAPTPGQAPLPMAATNAYPVIPYGGAHGMLPPGGQYPISYPNPPPAPFPPQGLINFYQYPAMPLPMHSPAECWGPILIRDVGYMLSTPSQMILCACKVIHSGTHMRCGHCLHLGCPA